MDQNTDITSDTKSKVNFDKNILDLFWNLCDKNTDTRLNACSNILKTIWKKQQEAENENELTKDLQYCIERLIKGLASPRDAARLGYTLLLTEILKRLSVVQLEEVLELIKKHLSLSVKQDKRTDIVFGHLFALTAIVRSGRLPNHACLPEVIVSLFDLCQGRYYILNAVYEVFLDIFSQLTEETFKSVWSHLKKKLSTGWESCSSDSFWLLLLCIRLFPNSVSTKYLKKHWGSDDLFASENLDNLKKIIKQTTSCLPKLHPLCSEFLLCTKKRKTFRDVWISVVDENLFIEQSEKAYVGFEMIKSVLQDSPTKNILKTVLSPKFQAVFSKSFLNNKHPMNSAATNLANFLYTFVKNSTVPDMQIIVLKAFFHFSSTTLEQILKKKEVSMIIQSLLPDAVKVLCDILKAMILKQKIDDDNAQEVKIMRRCQAVQQIASLITHQAMLSDLEWRMDVIKFLFLHSFFTIKETSSEIPHCDKLFEPLPDNLKDSCRSAFFRAVNTLHIKTGQQLSTVNSFLEQLTVLKDFGDMLLNAEENLEPNFSKEKVQNSWNELKSITHKLQKQSKKGKVVNESNAFLIFFLQLGLHLFEDPNSTSEILEELQICCKKFLKSHKHDADVAEEEEEEPPWIGVVVDILLSLLSKSSKCLRDMVTYIFPLFCPFVDEKALMQILDIINPQKDSEDMLVDEGDSDVENEQGPEFESGSSSSEESDDEAENEPVDNELRNKLQAALGPAAEDSEAESVVLSDSEMFKLDSAIADVFKSRKKSGHTQMKSDERALLDFRVRCLDLILAYLKTEPPMHLVLMCLEPVLAAFELGHSKHQNHLLHKAVSVLKHMTKMKKFHSHEGVSKSELKRLLDVLIPKCHKEIIMAVSKELSCLCVFIVLCYRKISNADSPDKKKSSKIPWYMKSYLSALETFVSSGNSHMLPQFFTQLMEACPDIAWYFIEPCKDYAFNSNVRLFKRTQCLGLLSESLKYSKNQKEMTDSQWLDFAKCVFPLALESIKKAIETDEIKQVYCTEILNIILTLHLVIKEKTNQCALEGFSQLLPLLNSEKARKLKGRGRAFRVKIVNILKEISGSNAPEVSNTDGEVDNSVTKRKKSSELDVNSTDIVNEGLESSEKPKKKRKKSTASFNDIHVNGYSENKMDVTDSEPSVISRDSIDNSFNVNKKKIK